MGTGNGVEGQRQPPPGGDSFLGSQELGPQPPLLSHRVKDMNKDLTSLAVSFFVNERTGLIFGDSTKTFQTNDIHCGTVRKIVFPILKRIKVAPRNNTNLK